VSYSPNNTDIIKQRDIILAGSMGGRVMRAKFWYCKMKENESSVINYDILKTKWVIS
jgi:hypothetical protein